MDFSKKISATTAALVLLSTAAVFPTSVASAATYDDSSYTTLSEGDIVQISTFDELTYFSDYVNNGGATNGITWQLTANIDASNSVFTSIASSEACSFNGTFNGNGYTISGLSGIPSLFGYLLNADVYNLTISDSKFSSTSGDAAALTLQSVGTDISYVTVNNTDVIASSGNAGGVVAFIKSPAGTDASSVLACQVIGDSSITNNSSSSYYTGGIIGNSMFMGGSAVTIQCCNNAADLYGNNTQTHGLVGNLGYTFTVDSSFSSGNVYSGTPSPGIHAGTYVNTYQIVSENQQTNQSGIYNYITADQVSSGEMAYTMENLRKSSNVGTSVFWTQNLTSDLAPVLSTSDEYVVYYNNGTYTNNYADVPQYDVPDMIKKFGKDCYQIDTYSELCWFAYAYNNGIAETPNAVLAANITADEDSEWTPIGADSSTPYTGIFYGERHTISGLDVSEGTNVGLFGYVSDATIQQLGVENSAFAGTIYVAPLAGVAVSSTIFECYAYNNSIICTSTSSGFIASAQNSFVSTSYTDSDKGLIGGGSSTISGCYHTGISSFGTAVTTDQISNGYVAYMLKQYTENNLGSTNNWGQNLSDNNSHPVLDTSYGVFCNGNGYDNVSPSDHAYINVQSNSDGTHNYDCSYCLQHVIENCRYSDGFCTICGYFDNSADYIIYSQSGTYTLPTPKAASATEQIIGWISQDGSLYQCGSKISVTSSLTLYKVTLDLNTVGASAKINNDSTGIKFATSLEIIGADYLTLDINVGTLICPTDYITSDSVLDYNNFIDNGYIALKENVEDAYFSEIVVNDMAYSNSYVGSIVNINAYNYAREFTGCGFVEVTYADNSVSYFYATAKSSQSIYSLAAKAYGDRVQTADDDYNNETSDISGNVYYSRYTANELDVLKGFIDGVVNFDIDLGNHGEVEIIIPEEVADFYESAYSASVNYSDSIISIIGVSDNWKCYVPVTKSTGITEYQRVAIMINGKRITYGNSTDNFEIPVSVTEVATDQSVMEIYIIGI